MTTSDLPVSRRAPAVRILFDTAFCLALIRQRPARLQELLTAYAPGQIAVSSLTVAALWARVQRSSHPTQNRRALEHFLLPLYVADFDAEAAHLLCEIAERWPSPPSPDNVGAQWLAAHAMRLNAALVTSRPDLYGDIPGLRVNTVEVQPLLAELSAAMPQAAASRTHAIREPHSGPGVILVIGSHDLTLELLGDWLHGVHPEVTLVSAHVGSLGGLLALQRNEAHLAGSHLLDAETGEYNKAHIQRLLTAHGHRVVLLGFVTRVQGLIVAGGNPKRIADLDDLVREDITFVNRQPGAGTRVLLDFELQRRGLDPALIQGYAREEASHLAVATAVAGGAADCGLGIQAAANTQDLDFVPLLRERYDLVIPVEHFESARLAPLVELLRRPTADFLRRVAALGGYETDMMGKVLAEL